MTMKGCPKCGQRWQDGNFCPVDGAKLEAVADGGAGAQTGPMPAQSRATAGEAPAAEDTDATVVEMSAIPASLAAEWLAAHRGAPVADPAARTAPDQVAKPAAAQAPASRPAAAAQAPAADVQQTRVELQAVPMSAAQRGQREARAAVPEPNKQLGDTALERIADRIKAEVARERPITAGSTLHTEAAPDPEAPTSAVARAEAKAARVEKKPTVEKRAPAAPKDEFSETQWFMKGLEVDADLLEVVDESEYKRSDKISDAQRSRMTLRRKDED